MRRPISWRRVSWWRACLACAVILLSAGPAAAQDDEARYKASINVEPPLIATDRAIQYDYDIVYVRARRAGDEVHKRYYTDFSQPVTMEPGADLMLLHPDGKEELLVEGGRGSITDPVVSFDGKCVYFVRIYNLENRNQWSPPREGADIFKIHLGTRMIVRLTNQRFTPNTGAADWAAGPGREEKNKSWYDYGVFNMGPCPLPGGRIAFTSNRDGFRPSKGYPSIALQLFTIDDSDQDVDAEDPYPRNIEKIGHMNVAGALHPVVLTDGRIIFSTLESQGIRSSISWGIWSIHPDGTNWNPVVSAFDTGGASNGFHFQAQLSDGSIIVEEYYNQNNSGFGAYIKLPAKPSADYAAFGPAYMRDERNPPWRFGRFDNGKGKFYRMPFMPTGAVSFTPFALNGEGPSDSAILGDKSAPKVGKVTHPSGAPDNHLLTIWSPGPANHQYKYLPQIDGGIYLIKDGVPVEEPGQMRLVKNDPEYNESWPRAVVPYERIYGRKEPAQLATVTNDGGRSKLLPAGTPYGLVGSSSFYKRESYPNGKLDKGSVTARFAGGNDPFRGLDPFTSHGNGMPINWHVQGGDVGLYENSEIHAVRILAMEPTTDRKRGPDSGRQFHSHAMERLRILGELPVRKFTGDGKTEPRDPDGNPDTSFLARIPADVPFTFQTIDKNGLMLNMAQTWHQLRPGEIRHDCGGCHAHSQKPTEFRDTAAASRDYEPFDLTSRAPLVTAKDRDESKRRHDADDASGLRYHEGALSVEYHRDIKPILARSCTACHTRSSDSPAGNLVLDDDDTPIAVENRGKFPGTYFRLAMDEKAKFGHKPIGYPSFGYPNASRYVRMLQARRSLLVWKIFGKRLDGFSNDDHPSESKPGAGDLVHRGQKVDIDKNRAKLDIDYTGGVMPPPAAVASGKVKPLTDEDRRTILRWIDLGCPIDLDYDPKNPDAPSRGWSLDDSRPTLTLAWPQPGRNEPADRIRIGAADYGSGLDRDSFAVTSDFEIAGQKPGTNLAPKFREAVPGVWELPLEEKAKQLGSGRLTVAVKDRQGNETRIVRTFSVE
jgi:hypothetical protein